MAKRTIDTTSNEHSDVAAAKHQEMFTDLYGVQGTFTANGTTQVAVANTKVTANSIIGITLKTVGGTVSPSVPYINTITPGTGFTIKATAGDTSVYNYDITF